MSKMTAISKVTQNHQVTIPVEILEKAGIGIGTILKFELREDGILLKPQDEEWFWTEKWQEKEREADEAVAQGKVVGPFDNIDDALQALKTAKV